MAKLELLITAKDNASGALGAIDKKAGGLGKTMGTVLKVGALAGVGAVAAMVPVAISAVGAASDLQEAANKAEVTFGDATKTIKNFADSSARDFGISQSKALEYSATLGVILQTSGLTQDATAGMSRDLVKLAADMASFNNIPVDVALQKIRAGLVGEAEPLRTVGVLLSEAAVQSKAVEMGLVSQGEKLRDAQKVQARYAIIMEQTAKQQGDFARTSDSLANRQRILAARWEDMRAKLGQRLLPLVVKGMGLFLNFADLVDQKVIPAVESFADTKLVPFLKREVLPVLADVFGVLKRDVVPQLVSFALTALEVGRGIATFLAPALDTLADLWRNALKPALDAVLPLLEKVGRFLLEHKPLILAVAGALLLLTNPWLAVAVAVAVVLAKWDAISGFFIDLGEKIDGFIDKVGEVPIIGAIFEDTWNTVTAVVETAFALILNRLKFYLDTIRNTFAFWKAIFSGDWGAAWDALRAQVRAVWDLVSGDFGALLDGFKAILGSKLELLKTVGKDIAGAIGDGLEAGLGFVKGSMNRVITLIERAINFIIDKWNELEFKLPKVDLGLFGSIGGGSIGTPDIPTISIPRLQRGGVLTRPTLFVGGETAAARPEIVSPEALLRRIVREEGGGGLDYDRLAVALARALVGVRIEMDGREVGRVQGGLAWALARGG